MTSLEIKRMFGKVWHYLLCNVSRRVILIYHSVGSGPWAISELAFHSQMEWLKAHAEVVPLDTLLSSPVRNGLQVSLTFDDGYRCLHDLAAPILRRLALPATVYLNTGMISANGNFPSDSSRGHYPGEEFMSWKEVVNLQGSGWLIGSHGVDHLDLTTTGPNDVRRQIGNSKKEIEERLGVSCTQFSYTWGRHDHRLRKSLKDAGYRHAVSGHHAPVCAADDPLMLPRLNIKREYTLDDFIAVVTGRWDYIGIMQKLKSSF